MNMILLGNLRFLLKLKYLYGLLGERNRILIKLNLVRKRWTRSADLFLWGTLIYILFVCTMFICKLNLKTDI